MTNILTNSSSAPGTLGRWSPTPFWRAVFLTLLAEAIAIVAFYSLEWSWLRQVHVLWLQSVLQALGCPVQAGFHALTVNGRPFEISPDCTYVDLMVCGIPLLWRFQRRWFVNIGVFALYSGVVLMVNLARVFYGVYAFSHGVNLFWSHDLVDYVLWYPTMGIVAFLWIRSLKHLIPTPPPAASGNEKTTDNESCACPKTIHAARREEPLQSFGTIRNMEAGNL